MSIDPISRPSAAPKRDFKEGHQDYLVQEILDPEFEHAVLSNLSQWLEERRRIEKALPPNRIYIKPGEQAPQGLPLQEGPRGGQYVIPGPRQVVSPPVQAPPQPTQVEDDDDQDYREKFPGTSNIKISKKALETSIVEDITD